MKTIHGVVRTDNMYGTDVRAGLVSIRYYDNGEFADIDNGCVLKVGALEGDASVGYEREIYKGTAPAANDVLDDVVLIASPEVMYDERLRSLTDYYNVAGKACRGYRFHKGDIFSVTKTVLDGKATPALGDIVELKAGIKMNVAASATSGSTKVGKIIAIDVVGQITYYAILVG